MVEQRYVTAKENLQRCLKRFYEIYSGENGLKSEILAGRTGDAEEQFYNTRVYFETEIPGSTWGLVQGRPVKLQVVFRQIQEKLEDKQKPTEEELSELEELLVFATK